MTENEAISKLEDFQRILTNYRDISTELLAEANGMAIQALEEIEQYRAIGLTPELIEAMQGHNIALINDLGEYQAIGTVAELKALKEKNETLKALYDDARKEGANLLANARVKAIDEFAEKMKELCKGITFAELFIDEVAEQLKGGAE